MIVEFLRGMLSRSVYDIIAFTKRYDHNYFMTCHMSGSEVSELNPLPVIIL